MIEYRSRQINRNPDCVNYLDCLSIASKSNSDLLCQSCDRYQKYELSCLSQDETDKHLIFVAAIKHPALYAKYQEEKKRISTVIERKPLNKNRVNRLSNILRKQGKTLSDCAKTLGVSVSALHNVVAGRFKSANIEQKLKDKLGIIMEEI